MGKTDAASIERLERWLAGVKAAGKAGPSPGGAAQRLGCSRSMVDALVERGILEREVYNADGHKLVIISMRTIVAAVKVKRETGKWTDSRREGKGGANG